MGKTNPNGFALPSFTKKVVGGVGAGDALLAYASLSLAATKSVLIASILGALAASCECEKEGNIAISPDQVLKKIEEVKNSLNYSTISKL